MSRRFATQQQAADRLQVTTKTIRNYVSNGLLVGYRLPGARAIRVDLDELDRVMKVIPTTVARPGHRAFGPKARIVTVIEAVEPAVVEGGGE
jgi:excisionase family DNA binding protein